MRDRCARFQRILTVFLLSLLACGCLAKSTGAPHTLPDSLTALSRTLSPADRIVATARIDLLTAQGHYPLQAALIIQKPSCLRLEILPVIGTPDFFLTATSDDMKIWIPSQGEFYAGKPTAANLARFLNWGMNIDDMVSILAGSYPFLGEDQVAVETLDEGALLRVDMKVPRGPSQTLWLNRSKRMTRLIRYGSDGRELYSVLYDDYMPENPVAGKISIRSADDVTSMTLKYLEVKIEKAADMKVFDLPVPAGAKIIKLD